MQYYIEFSKEHISGDKSITIDLDTALFKVEEMINASEPNSFIGFINDADQTLQFQYINQDKWLMDEPILKNGQYISSRQTHLSSDQVKPRIEDFFNSQGEIIQPEPPRPTATDYVNHTQEASLKIALAIAGVALLCLMIGGYLAVSSYSGFKAEYLNFFNEVWQEIEQYGDDLNDIAIEDFQTDTEFSTLNNPTQYLPDLEEYRQLIEYGHIDQAIDMILNSQLSLDRQVDYLAELVGYFIQQTNYDSAIKAGQAMVKIYPNYYSYNSLGWVYLEQEDYATAIKYFNLSIEDNDSFRSAYNNLGICYKESGNYPKAEESYLKAILLDPSNPKAYSNLAYVYINTNRNELGIEFLEKALLLDKKAQILETEIYSSAYWWLGYLYYTQQDYALCAHNFNQYLKYEPEDTSIDQMLNTCLIESTAARE